MLYMYTTKDLLQSYELSIVLNEWQMFDDIKLRKCWQQLKSITKANVFVVYVILSTLITIWTMHLPFHSHSLRAYAKIFISIMSTNYIALWMTNVWLYQTKKVLTPISNHNEAYCASYVLKSNWICAYGALCMVIIKLSRKCWRSAVATNTTVNFNDISSILCVRTDVSIYSVWVVGRIQPLHIPSFVLSI